MLKPVRTELEIDQNRSETGKNRVEPVTVDTIQRKIFNVKGPTIINSKVNICLFLHIMMTIRLLTG